MTWENSFSAPRALGGNTCAWNAPCFAAPTTNRFIVFHVSRLSSRCRRRGRDHFYHQKRFIFKTAATTTTTAMAIKRKRSCGGVFSICACVCACVRSYSCLPTSVSSRMKLIFRAARFVSSGCVCLFLSLCNCACVVVCVKLCEEHAKMPCTMICTNVRNALPHVFVGRAPLPSI